MSERIKNSKIIRNTFCGESRHGGPNVGGKKKMVLEASLRTFIFSGSPNIDEPTKNNNLEAISGLSL